MIFLGFILGVAASIVFYFITLKKRVKSMISKDMIKRVFNACGRTISEKDLNILCNKIRRV